MRELFQAHAKDVEDINKTGRKVFGFVAFMKHTQDNAADIGEEAMQKKATIEKESAELSGDGKSTVTMGDIDDHERHRSSPANGVYGFTKKNRRS